MAQVTLVSAALMGLFLLAVVAFMARARNWQRGSVRSLREREPGAAFADAADDPAVWTAAFFILVFVVGAGAVAYVGGIPMIDGEAVGLAVIGLFVALLGLYVVGGVYVAARGRGLKSSQAAGMSSAILGLLLIVAVVAKLLTTG